MANEIAERLEAGQEVSIVLRYTGPTVDEGSMDVYSVASNMLAFSEYVTAAAHAVYGKEVLVKAEVRAFKRGSFATDLAFKVVGLATAMWQANPDLSGMVMVMKQAIGLYKFLGGKEPKAIEYNDDHSVNVTNNAGSITVVHIDALNLTLDPKAGDAVGTFVGQALAKAGMDSVELSVDATPVAIVDKEDADSFHRINLDSTRTTNTTPLSLTIETPNFKDGTGNKWRFWDGENSFAAPIEDASFLQRVDNGEPFRKGDVLDCIVRIDQYRVGRALKAERSITQVIKHRQMVFDQGEMSV